MKQFNNEFSSLSQNINDGIDYRCFENKARTLRAEAFIKASSFTFIGKLYSSAKNAIKKLTANDRSGAQNVSSKADSLQNPATC